MTRFTKTLIAAAALISLAGTAHAQDTYKVSFTFDKNATIEANYSSFASTAKKVCKNQSRTTGHRSLGYTKPLENACELDLISKAVAATKNNVLIAYHQDQIDPNAAPTKLASAK